MQQITRDHSLVQELVESGVIRPEEAEHHPRANVITRAVGAEVEDFVLDKVSGRIQVGDRFLLCSDGLCKTVPATNWQVCSPTMPACHRPKHWLPRRWR